LQSSLATSPIHTLP